MIGSYPGALLLGAGLSLLRGVIAQQQAYGQCGGIGYTGATTCVSGYTCKAWNDYYYQCVPDSDVTTTTSSSTSSSTGIGYFTSGCSDQWPPCSQTASSASTLVTVTKTSSSSATQSSATSSASGGAQCTGTFDSLTAQQFVDALHPGWNLGNTLDAVETEGDWGNPPVVESTFDDVKAAGFKSVRLPVTWAYHFTGSSPDWTVDPTWLQRVSDVIDMVTSRGLYTIVNVHHDSWIWADVSASGANITQIEEKFYRLWYQIGTKLACKSSLVAFEPINEPVGSTEADATELNKLNNLFLQAINDAGGFNSQRVVTLVGLGEDGVKTSEWFEAPDPTYANPWAIQYHYYSPYDFIFSAWGKTIWGSDADKQTLEADIAAVRGNFSDVPLLIGEWDASPTNTETAARRKYFDFLTRTAQKYNTSTVLWDNGQDHLDRAAHTWRDPSAIEVHIAATNGETNSLPDSTEDSAATEQWTSAYVFLQANSTIPAAGYSLPWVFNDNTLTSITTATGTTLSSATDYTVSGANITLSQSFLTDLIPDLATPGSKANLTLAFSAGAPETVEVVVWDTPELASTSAAAVAGQQVSIPIVWKGLHRVAAVKALRTDGVYLVDDWTVWLGPLQQARATYSSQYTWDAADVVLTADAASAVVSAGVSTVFTFEFFPRVPGNAVNFTLTV